jgi:hypothetical protein
LLVYFFQPQEGFAMSGFYSEEMVSFRVNGTHVHAVLNTCGKNTPKRLKNAKRAVSLQRERVEESASRWYSTNNQRAAALSEIEDILLEEGILSGDKLFDVDIIAQDCDEDTCEDDTVID